jgi:hypothetical protein
LSTVTVEVRMTRTFAFGIPTFVTSNICLRLESKYINFWFLLVPPPVINLHVARTTMTAVRIAWEIPDLTACNSFKGYQIYLSKTINIILFSWLKTKRKYLDDTEYEFTTECGITISSLTINTTYQIDVCVVTIKGKGPRASINVKTSSAGRNFELFKNNWKFYFRRLSPSTAHVYRHWPTWIAYKMATTRSDSGSFYSLWNSL